MHPPKTSLRRAGISHASRGQLFYAFLFLVLLSITVGRARAQSITGDTLWIYGAGEIDDNLSVGGGLGVSGGLSTDTLDVSDGATITGGLGVDTLSLSYASFSTTYEGGIGYVNSSGSVDSGTFWTWANVPDDDSQVQMTLDPDSVLTLVNSSGNLVVDPGNQSLFFNNLSIKEASSTFLMSGSSGCITFDPNGKTISFSSGLTINGSSSLVYNAEDSGFVAGNGATASGYRSAAFGGSANATANSSVALAGALANGNFSVGFAGGTANGTYSMAVGNLSIANATGAMALGGGNVGTGGLGALAFGGSSYANSTGAMALGNGTTAQAWSTLTVGHYNANITGNSTAWAATDPAFIVGIGNSTTRTNGLVVLNNGNTTIGTNLTISNNLTVSGRAAIGESNPGRAFVVTTNSGGETVSGLPDYGSPNTVFSNGSNINGARIVGTTQSFFQLYTSSHSDGAYIRMIDSSSTPYFQMGFDESNVIAYTVLANGNIGIGFVTNPQNTLDIGGSLAIGSYAGSNTAPTNGAIISGNVGIGTSSAAATLTVNGSLSFRNASGTTLFATDSTGTALSLGINASTSGNNALALGTNVTAKTWSGVTVGHFNTSVTGNTTAWAATDPAFIVGIGQNSSATANGLVVLNNGNTTINGNLTVTGVINGNISGGGSSNVGSGTGSNSITLGGGTAGGSNSLVWDGGNASGNNSLAFGLSTNSSGNGSLAFGTSSIASGLDGISFDGGNASGNNSLAWSGGNASGTYAVAFGVGTNATGNYSFALGNSSVASAPNAIALGGGNATGNNSLSFGLSSNATGNGSITLGANLTANALNSVTVGHYNSNVTGSSTTWVTTDPAFIVGTGNSTASANSLVVLNNGNATVGSSNTSVLTVLGSATLGNDTTTTTTVSGNLSVGGVLTGNVVLATPQGDILMGEFGD